MNICPAYMAMGMTWNQFWHCNTKVHRSYRLAWEQRKQYRNWEMWWQGGYIYEALLKVAPVMRAAFGKGKVEAGKYSEEPYPLTEREAEERREAQRRQKMERMFEMFKRESAENLRKREQGTGNREQEEATDAAGDEGSHPSPATPEPQRAYRPGLVENSPLDCFPGTAASPTGEGFEDGGKLEAKGD